MAVKRKMKDMKSVKLYIIPVFIAAILTAVDQITKFIITSTYKVGDSKPLIDGVFNITYVRNEGMAWGAFKGGRYIFLAFTVVVLLFAMYVYARVAGEKGFFFFRVCLLFLISGAIGNMIDRAVKGYVVDFLDFSLIKFPVFNVADIFLTVSLILLAVMVIFFFDDDKFNKAFSFKKQEKEEADE